FVVRLNHRRVLSGLLEAAGVEPQLHGAALVAIDKLDKIGKDGVHAELIERGIQASIASQALATFDGALTIPAARERLARHPEAAAGVEELHQILSLAERTSAGPH